MADKLIIFDTTLRDGDIACSRLPAACRLSARKNTQAQTTATNVSGQATIPGMRRPELCQAWLTSR